MTKNAQLTFLLIVFFSLINCSNKNTTVNGQALTAPTPTNLTVEFIRNTKNVVIIDQKPEFAWVVPTTVQKQMAYQILVASSSADIKANTGDLWDSGKITENNSSSVSYLGKELQDDRSYYWKVRIWTADDEASEYSKPQQFKVASSDSFISSGNSFQLDSIAPVLFEKRGDFFFIDFGKAAFATLAFTYEAKTDHTLIFRLGEQLRDKNINREPSKKSTIRYQELKLPVKKGKNTYQLQLIPDKRNTLPGKALPLPKGFPVLMPFRYVEVEGMEDTISNDDFVQLAYHGYWEENASTFESSNDILNQVWDLCKYSIKATTFNGLYVDGDRERIPYEADAYLNQLSHYSADREYAMARRTIEYFMGNPTWPTEWQQHVALMFYADYMYTGDSELIEKYYEQLKYKTLMELAREDGLISSTNATPAFMKKLGFKDSTETLRDITDWPPANWSGDPNVTGERDGFIFMPYNTVINAFYYQNMKIMTEFAQLLGKTSEESDFRQKAENVKKTINAKLLDSTKGYYVDGEGTDHSSLHANMMALAFDIVPEEYKSSVIAFVKSRGMACSVYGSQYLMDGLYNVGEADYALWLLTDTSDRSWYNMIKIGSTITLEAWDMKYKPNADWNHAWGAVPANVIPRGLWGITPKVAGYEVATIKPQLSTLEQSSIEVPTIKGTIKASYRKDDSGIFYEIEIPGNMRAEFKIVQPQVKSWTHDDKKESITSAPLILTSGKHIIEL